MAIICLSQQVTIKETKILKDLGRTIWTAAFSSEPKTKKYVLFYSHAAFIKTDHLGVPRWLAQSEEHVTLDLMFMNLSPTLGVEIT